jgi:hypothetical protein
VTNRTTGQNFFFIFLVDSTKKMKKKDGGKTAQKRPISPLPDAVCIMILYCGGCAYSIVHHTLISINWRSGSKKNQFLTSLNEKFSQEDTFHYWAGRLPGHDHVNQTHPDVVRMWRQFLGCPACGSGIERVFFSAGKQHDALKKNTMDKTLKAH